MYSGDLEQSPGTRGRLHPTSSCTRLALRADHTFLRAQGRSPLYFLLREAALLAGEALPLPVNETVVSSRPGALALWLVYCSKVQMEERGHMPTGCSRVLGNAISQQPTDGGQGQMRHLPTLFYFYFYGLLAAKGVLHILPSACHESPSGTALIPWITRGGQGSTGAQNVPCLCGNYQALGKVFL